MSSKLKITYLFESTTLWGGNKVALEQAEALSDAGYQITLLSKDSGPTWYPLKLPVISAPNFDSVTIPESDIIVGTYWPTVKAAYESGRGMTVHLCQGYEGDYKEISHLKAAIDEVYSYPIPKLTVSPHLDKFLARRFNAETYYIGQMLNRKIFYPSNKRTREKWLEPLRKLGLASLKILVVGPFQGDFKNVPTALGGVLLARKRLGIPIKLVRASQFPLTQEEIELIKPDSYHFHVQHYKMGEIYRNSDLFISVSKEAEGFGLPAIEAMGCGIPVILSRISSYTSFDDRPDYAFFVDSQPGAVSEAIKKIYRDTDLRLRLSKRGLEVSEKFDSATLLKRLINAFESIISRK
jgi:glycosyltransferase involved in cell wall biosynthesis